MGGGEDRDFSGLPPGPPLFLHGVLTNTWLRQALGPAPLWSEALCLDKDGVAADLWRVCVSKCLWVCFIHWPELSHCWPLATFLADHSDSAQFSFMCIPNKTIPGLSDFFFFFPSRFKPFVNVCWRLHVCPRWDLSRPCGFCQPCVPAPGKEAAGPPWTRRDLASPHGLGRLVH